MSSPNPDLLDEPFWTIFNAIDWIRCRSRHEFGKIKDDTEFRAAVKYGPPELNPWKALTPLLHALQLGHTQGVKDKQLLPPEYWADINLITLRNERKVSLPSARVLELWPPRAAVQALGPLPQADAPAIAEPAVEATPHVVEQATLIHAPDASPATKKRRKRMKPKRDTILQGLFDVYPNGHHPSITPSEARNKVTPWLEENHPGFVPKTEQGLPIDTVRLALKEFQALSKKV
jgi:hypothetical protein